MNKIIKEDIARWLPKRDEKTYKNKLGHVLCIGGSKNMGGAIILSASAAVYAGAGLVTVASAPENMNALHARLPEAMFINHYEMNEFVEGIKKADIIVIGPGLGLSNHAQIVFKTVMETIVETQWLIIDGDALTLLANTEIKLPIKNIVLTPHLGEWKRLTQINDSIDDVQANKKWRDEKKVTVILKKERTEVYFSDRVWQNTAGNPSMATGGMGDTLTGIIASFLGQFENKKQAILSAVYIHSAVADELAKTHYVTLPSEVINALPLFMRNLIK